MADRVLPGPVDGSTCINEAVCVHTNKIFDSCKDKDCIEDLRVYPSTASQAYIDAALSIRPKCAELLFARVNVDEICFNRGYYTVDVTYFYKINGDTFPGNHSVTGLAIFDKRVILYGSESSSKVFSSAYDLPAPTASLPTAIVEAVDPIALNMKLADKSCCTCAEPAAPDIPDSILAAFGEPVNTQDSSKIWYVTLGQFSIIRLERDTNLVMPVYDYCIPEKDCVGSTDDDPCTLFGRIRFPVEEFYPPDRTDSCEDQD